MNIQDYISSGIIESYILGQLSDKECSELQALTKQHPEIQAEIEAVEEALMTSVSKTPPPALKQTILSKLNVKEAKVIALETKKSSLSLWLVAASVAVLIGSGIYNIILMNQLESVKNQLALNNSEKEKYAKDFEAQSASYTMMAQQMAILMQPENKKVMLKGMDVAPTALATVYWNQKNQDVYININELPLPDENKQYQLWAIVDGKPVDIGMLDMNPELPPLHKMKTISGAQAFAVTLEKKGGSPTPTMTAMYLMGSV